MKTHHKCYLFILRWEEISGAEVQEPQVGYVSIGPARVFLPKHWRKIQGQRRSVQCTGGQDSSGSVTCDFDLNKQEQDRDQTGARGGGYHHVSRNFTLQDASVVPLLQLLVPLQLKPPGFESGQTKNYFKGIQENWCPVPSGEKKRISFLFQFLINIAHFI